MAEPYQHICGKSIKKFNKTQYIIPKRKKWVLKERKKKDYYYTIVLKLGRWHLES
jgi:hypothetical protein